MIILFSKQRMERTFAERNLPINQIRYGPNRGSANDGNLFRSLFRDHADFFAEQTGFPVELINGLWNVYLAMTARCIDIDVDKYEALCKRVRQLWRQHIPWYPMCVSTHRVLRHSPNMLRRILVRFPTLRLSHLSEESGESLNKYLKSYQLEHAFQGDLRKRNLHTFRKLIARSDPEVHRHFDRATVKAEQKKRPLEDYPPEIQALAKSPPESEDEDENEE